MVNNIKELRKFLSDGLSKLRDGSSTAASANAEANLAGKMLNSLKLEIEHNRLTGSNAIIDFFI